MKLSNTKYLFITVFLLYVTVLSQTGLPEVYTIDPNLLVHSKELVASQSPDVMPAYMNLIKTADKFLKKGPFSVTKKEKTPPSGDKHDYLSLSIYSWPNPKTKDSLPYITRDGQVNPISKKGNDGPAMVQMCEITFTLALAYYLSGNEKYAEHSAELLRVWFINPATKMNPNLKYAQQVLGKNEGSAGGIIDSRNLINVTEAAGLLEGSKSWSNEDRNNLIAWFKDFLNWLLTSDNGKTEGKATNNHVTFYKSQVINYELFTEKTQEAKQQLESVKDLIAAQIEPDGTQPLELNRTKSFNYSVFNLQAFFLLTELGKNAGVDLYGYQTDDGRSIRKALDFIAPYTDTTKQWPYKEIAPFAEGKYWLSELFRMASLRYPDGNYESILKNNFDESFKTKQWNLLYPAR